MSDFEPCTTHSRRLRHYAIGLNPASYAPGRSGITLCGHDGQDGERANYYLSRYSERRVDIAALPECKKCVKQREVIARKAGGDQ